MACYLHLSHRTCDHAHRDIQTEMNPNAALLERVERLESEKTALLEAFTELRKLVRAARPAATYASRAPHHKACKMWF